VSVATDGYHLSLADASDYGLAPGSRTALIGAGAAEMVAGLARQAAEQQTVAAWVLADSARPLHSAYRVGDQIAAALGGTRRAAVDRATDLLEAAGISEPHERVHARPHELSGLDRQRAQLALALANRPGLLLGEDPVNGLTVAEAAAFAAALARLHARLGFTWVLSAPERSRTTRLVDEILMLENGRIIERLRRQP
jgi:ABC-type microcin C transport system duplicated ATPase subunit YejF